MLGPNDIVTRNIKAMYPILNYFEYKHLPPLLQGVSKHFYDLAYKMALTDSGNNFHHTEVSAGLRKLLEAKDCFVRANIRFKPESEIDF